MIKTTVYLNEGEMEKLRRIAQEDGRVNLASLIRQAVKNFVHAYIKKPHDRFVFTKKLLKQKSRLSSFGDPVAFQQKLRSEWR